MSSGDLGLTADDTASVLPSTGGTLEAMERHWILTTLKHYGGSQRAAAKALGIDRSTLHRKLGQYGQ